MRTGGVILAAGEGRRFGAPKQLARLRGAPLLQHAIDTMHGVPAVDPIVLVLGARAYDVRAAVDPGAAEVVVCEDWAQGMAASLRAGIAALGKVDWALVTLGDQPLISPQVIAMIADRAAGAAAGTVAVRATYGGEDGHPVALSAALFGRIAELRGDHGARDLLFTLRAKRVEAGHLCSSTDIDTRDDLQAIGG